MCLVWLIKILSLDYLNYNPKKNINLSIRLISNSWPILLANDLYKTSLVESKVKIRELNNLTEDGRV